MLNQLSSVIQRLSELESDRQKDKSEIATLKNLLNSFNDRVKKLEDDQVMNSANLETTKELVEEMLSDIPQAPSIENRFSALEEKIDQISHIGCKAGSNNSDTHYSANQFRENYGMPSPHIEPINLKPEASVISCYAEPYPDPMTIAEMANEIEERTKRNKNLVIHNLPEGNYLEDEEEVSKLLCEVLDCKTKVEVETDEYTSKPKIYRLGRKESNKVRSLKIHLKTASTRDQILENTRRLSSSNNFSNTVIQKDMTPLERVHLRRLVYEKNRRNHIARMNQQEPIWTIRGGIICQKTYQ